MKVKEESLIGTLAVLGVAAALGVPGAGASSSCRTKSTIRRKGSCPRRFIFRTGAPRAVSDRHTFEGLEGHPLADLRTDK
jgi:hypothetical protein